jgi:hypothetical protein
MAQHRLKIILTAGALSAALAVGVCGDAYAFTETAPPPVSQSAKPAPQLQPPGGDTTQPLVAPDTKSGGTELRIPGIGSLGIVPKLDFGLDLLYGAGSDPAQEQQPLPPENNNQDVTIKGTIRHRF